MGTSTVSGPFRSENGFEQLVDGEWVPVSGGGSPLSLTTTGTSGPATLVGSNLNIPNYSTGGGSPLSLTTTGTSGPATLVGNNLNIPNYATGGGGSSPTIIPVTPGGTTYTLPAFTEVGQTATFLWEFHYPDGSLTLTIAPMAGFDTVIFTGVEINFNNNSNIQDVNITTVTGTSTSASYIVASFSGIWEYEGNVYAIINLNVINTILAG